MLAHNTLRLFSPFQRNVGNPQQYPIYSQKDFEDFIIRNNGIKDCSSSVYSQESTIDKIWFDFDGIGAIDEARKLYAFLRGLDAMVFPIISGKKGIHLHLLLNTNVKANSDNAKEILMDTIILIISNGLGLRDWKQPTTLDWSKLGAINVTCRIPNTLRPPANTTWSSYLPQNWNQLTETEIWDYAKSPHSFNYTGQVFTPDQLSSKLDELEVNFKFSSGAVTTQFAEEPTFPSTMFEKMSQKDLVKALEKIMRPCLYRHIISSNPRNDARVAVVLDLLAVGLRPQEILTIFNKLKWDKYDEGITKSKVMYIADRFYGEQTLTPYSCAKLRQINLPRVCCVE